MGYLYKNNNLKNMRLNKSVIKQFKKNVNKEKLILNSFLDLFTNKFSLQHNIAT